MKNKFYLIITLIYFLTGCNENSKQSTSSEHPKTTKEVTEEKAIKVKSIKSEPKKIISQSNTTINEEVEKVISKKAPVKKAPVPTRYHYKFENLKNQANTLDIINDKYYFRNIKQPIVIMTIMATWCPPCRGQIPHLSKLQQKFKKNIFVMSLLVHDDLSKDELNKFVIAQKMLFYLSINQEENMKFSNMITPKLGLSQDFPLPLIIVFIRGKYFTHYEGMIPEEMIESDIKQLLKKIKNK